MMKRLLLLFIGFTGLFIVDGSGLHAQSTLPKLMPTINSGAAESTAVNYFTMDGAIKNPIKADHAMKAYRFSGRETGAKFTLPEQWIVLDNRVTLSSTSTRFIPSTQTPTLFNQRIGIQELPSWVSPTRLGKEYVADIMGECVTGQLKPLEKGRVSEFPTDIVLLECTDSATQTVKLAIAALIQTPLANIAFSRMVRLNAKDSSPTKTVSKEIELFKSLIAELYICTTNHAVICN